MLWIVAQIIYHTLIFGAVIFHGYRIERMNRKLTDLSIMAHETKFRNDILFGERYP